MPISLNRQARIGNGLVLIFCTLLVFPATTRETGFVLTALMGIGLIATGVFDFCSFVAILRRMPWNR